MNCLKCKKQIGNPNDYCYVYIIRCGDSHFYKVGLANNPEQRLSTLQCASPYELSLTLSHLMPDRHTALTLETHLHGALKHCNVKFEWFELSDKVLGEVIEETKRRYTHEECPDCYKIRAKAYQDFLSLGGRDTGCGCKKCKLCGNPVALGEAPVEVWRKEMEEKA